MRIFFLVLHLLITLVMIGLVLLQKGEEVSAGSGGGSYNQAMSGRGSKNILTRITSFCAAFFFINCLILAILVRKESVIAPASPKEAPSTFVSPRKS